MDFLSKFPKLEYLNIGLNPIDRFPKSILELKHLEHLNISFVNIDIIPDEILDLKQLKTIDLTGVKIKNSNILSKLSKNGIKIIS
jgi:Leucine-rich repeat (LRR) protein